MPVEGHIRSRAEYGEKLKGLGVVGEDPPAVLSERQVNHALLRARVRQESDRGALHLMLRNKLLRSRGIRCEIAALSGCCAADRNRTVRLLRTRRDVEGVKALVVQKPALRPLLLGTGHKVDGLVGEVDDRADVRGNEVQALPQLERHPSW